MRRRATAAALLAAALCARTETIHFTADSMTGFTKEDSDYTKLTGSATITMETMSIAADTIELSGEDFRYIKATGSVSGSNSESKLDFTCGEMLYDRTTKIVTLRDTVHLIDVENDVVADAQLIEYNQDTEIAVMQISVSIKQEDNTCTAAYAIYHKAEQTLSMSGNPQVVQGQDTFRAQEISLNLDTQEILLDGRVRGTVTTQEQQPEE